MSDLRQIRRVIADATATLPDDAALPAIEALDAATSALVAEFPGVIIRRQIGRARSGTPLSVLTVGDEPAPTMLVIAMPRGDAPVGALTALALARVLGRNAALRRELGVAWQIVPCADPDGARLNAGWFDHPFTRGRYARNAFLPSPEERIDWHAGEGLRPETAALTHLIDAVQPRTTLLLYDTPVGGAALFEARDAQDEGRTGSWPGTATDSSLVPRASSLIFRLLDLLGVPLDLGGVFGPVEGALVPAVYPLAAAVGARAAGTDAYGQLLAERDTAVGPGIGRGLAAYAARYAGESGFSGALVVPRFVDYDRREADRTPAARTLRDVTLEDIQLRREWLAFGRATLDMVAPLPAETGLADTPLRRAVDGGLRGADEVLAGGVPDATAVRARWQRWAARLPGADRPATVAEQFAHTDCVRAARLPQIGMLARLLEDLISQSEVERPAIEAALAAASDLRDRWIDDLEAPATFRPVPLSRLVSAQIGTILAFLPPA